MTKRYKNRVHRALNDMEWMGEDDGYEYSEPHKKFRRNKIDGVFGGVCAGIGDYIGLDPVIVRVLLILMILFTGFPVLVYFLLWIFIPSDKRAPYRREYREARDARRDRKSRKKASFDEPPAMPTASLEVRLQDLEKSITSKEWQLRRQFRDLEN